VYIITCSQTRAVSQRSLLHRKNGGFRRQDSTAVGKDTA
jgi:hypothetical protein